jgi:hypothetical protein
MKRLVISIPVVLAACGGGSGAGGVSPDSWPTPDRAAACYDLRYDQAGARFPAMLVLDKGGRSGRAFWYPASRGDTAWRPFYAQGRWTRPGRGRVSVTFENDGATVAIDLESRGRGTVVGHGTRREPGREGSEPAERSAAVEGSHVSCPRPPSPDQSD